MIENNSLLEKWEECKVLIQEGKTSQALELLYQLSEQGVQYAKLEIGNIFESGIGDVDQDLEEALKWYENAHEATNDLEAILRMARIYLFAADETRDYSKALELYSRDAVSKNPTALLNIGLIYENGLGVQKDLESARGFYERAIDAGSIFARVNLAKLFWNKKKYSFAIYTRLQASVTTLVQLVLDADGYSEKIRRY